MHETVTEGPLFQSIAGYNSLKSNFAEQLFQLSKDYNVTIPHEEKIFSYLNQTEIPLEGNNTNYYGLAY